MAEPGQLGGDIANRVRDNYGIAVQGRDIRDSVLRFQVVNHFGGGIRSLRPRPGAVLVRRSDEIAAMWRAVQRWRSAVALIAVTGPAGAGATVLAEMLLHDVERTEPDRFPGGVRTLDLRSRSAAQAAWDLLADLGVPPGDAPLDPDLRLARYREATRRNGAMGLLLDNAASIGTVEQLIPAAPGSVVVLTAKGAVEDIDRRSPWAAGVGTLCPIELGPLSVDGAADLFRLCRARTPGAEETTAEYSRTAVAGTDRHPMTIVLSARRGTGGAPPRTGPATEGTEMADAVAASYARLPREQAALLRRIAHHPAGDFGPGAAAAVLGGGAAPDAALAALCDAELLTRTRAGGNDRFTLPDRVRTEALRRSRHEGPAEGRAAFEAIGAYYLGLARGAHARLLPDRWLVDGTRTAPDAVFADTAGALQRMEAERAAFAQFVEAAFDAGEYLLVCGLCEALWAFYFRRSCYPDWIRTHEFAVRAARALGDPGRPMLSRMLVQLARPYFEKYGEEPAEGRRGSAATALDHTEEAVAVARAAGHGLATLTALEALGKLYEAGGALEDAARLHADALAIAEALDPPDPRAVMNARHQLGRAELALGRLGAAESALTAALRAAGALAHPDDYNTARIAASLGELRAAQGDTEGALRHWDTAVALHEKTGDGKRTADALVQRARARHGTGAPGAAEDLSRAVVVYTVIEQERQAAAAAALLREWGPC